MTITYRGRTVTITSLGLSERYGLPVYSISDGIDTLTAYSDSAAILLALRLL